MSYRLVDSYRLLVAELLVCPTHPCIHEGMDIAVSDFKKTSDEGPRRILQQLSTHTRLGDMTVEEIKRYASVVGRRLDEAEAELLASKQRQQ
jgi:hypothetical protein